MRQLYFWIQWHPMTFVWFYMQLCLCKGTQLSSGIVSLQWNSTIVWHSACNLESKKRPQWICCWPSHWQLRGIATMVLTSVWFLLMHIHLLAGFTGWAHNVLPRMLSMNTTGFYQEFQVLLNILRAQSELFPISCCPHLLLWLLLTKGS